MKQNVLCRYNKYGHCKYCDKCHFRHVNVICVKQNCSVFYCENRHPVICKYFRNFRRCKFSNCSYTHLDNNEANATEEKIRVLEAKVMEIEKEGGNKRIK